MLTVSQQYPSIQYFIRKNEDRGGSDRGWLKTFHSFSTDKYPQKEHPSLGSLIVLNEDRVEVTTGFGEHGHKEFEIFSYVVSGELEHKDSMGNVEILRRGDIQLTSAGTGIRHSEGAHGDAQVHFLQVWTKPSLMGLKPKYFTRHFTEDQKMNKWARVVAPVASTDVSEDRTGAGPAPIQSPITLYATLLSPSKSLSMAHTLSSSDSLRTWYIHVIQTSGYNPGKSHGAHIRTTAGEGVSLGLREGDGAIVFGAEVNVTNIGDRVAEVLLFEIE